MLDLNNSCTTSMVCSTAQKIQYSKHNLQYIHSQHNTTDKEHYTTQNTCTHAGLNALAVVQTQSTTYMAQCTGSSTNKLCDLQHITHKDTMHYLHMAHTAQQNR